jgi:2-haloacid dehalogenase
MAVRALIFDVFGTLADWRSGIAAAFREAGVPGDADELSDAWRARGMYRSSPRSTTTRDRGATSTTTTW